MISKQQPIKKGKIIHRPHLLLLFGEQIRFFVIVIITVPWGPDLHPKWHLTWFSCFCKAHGLDPGVVSYKSLEVNLGLTSQVKLACVSAAKVLIGIVSFVTSQLGMSAVTITTIQ